MRSRLNWTRRQADALYNKNQSTKWLPEDIVAGLTLRAFSERGYQYLRKKRLLPLPGIATLRRHIRGFKCLPGTLTEILQIISQQREILGDGTDKPIPVALCFDEMSLHKSIQFDNAEEKTYGPHKQAQVIMIRGLFKNFKQPIFYDFDVNMTKILLFKGIKELDDIGFRVESVTSDMGTKNMGLWKELGIGPDCSHFEYNGRKIQVFADIPHVLKLLRNHYLDQGFVLQSGECFFKKDLQDLLNTDELRINHKLKKDHFECSGSQRQNVALAAQLFSRRTACALRLLNPDKKEQADFVELINNCFDIMNSRSSEGHKQYDYALGWENDFKKMVNQLEILNKSKNEIANMRIIIKVCKKTGQVFQKKSLLPFQKGWIVSINAAIELVDKLRLKYDAMFLLTARVNQDCLECLFGIIRFIGGPNAHPGCVEFKNRLRLFLLGRSSAFIVKGAAVKADEEEGITLSEQILEGIDNEEPDPLLYDIDIGAQQEVEKSSSEIDCTDEAKKYLAGYIAFKFKNTHPELGKDGTLELPVACPWIDCYSFGGLTKPSASWLETFCRLEGEFHNIHGTEISKESNIIKKLSFHLMAKFPQVPEKVIKFYSKMRIHIRVNFLRRTYKTSSEENRPTKKVKQFTT